MEINEETLKMLREMGVGSEHSNSVQTIDSYIKNYRLSELFNELMTHLMHKKPEDPKAAVLEYLKGIKKIQANKQDPLD